MGMKLRKMVMNRKQRCDFVVAAIKVQGPEIGCKLGEFLAPILAQGEAPADMAKPLEQYGRRLQSFCDVMVSADEAHLIELVKLDMLRGETTGGTRALKTLILDLRTTCQGLYGKESLRALNLDFKIARDGKDVLRQAEIVRQRLASPDVMLTPAGQIKGSLDREDAVQGLDRHLEILRSALSRLLGQSKRVDTKKVRKDQAIQEFDRNFILIARVIEAAFRAAGETELANRIRPSIRQLRGVKAAQESPSVVLATEPSEPSEPSVELHLPQTQVGRAEVERVQVSPKLLSHDFREDREAS